MWHVLRLTFDVLMVLGAIGFFGWVLLCLASAAVTRNSERYRRMRRASNHRVGGVISP